MSVCVFVLFSLSFHLRLPSGYYAFFLDWKLICNCRSSYFAVSTIVHIISFPVVRQLSCSFFSYTPHLQFMLVTQTFPYVHNSDLCSFRINAIVQKITVSNIKTVQFFNCAPNCNIQQWKPLKTPASQRWRRIVGISPPPLYNPYSCKCDLIFTPT